MYGPTSEVIRMRTNCAIYGQAYDSHCNLVLGEVEETIYVVNDDEDDDSVKVCATMDNIVDR
jgi:small nuclear ribonucleoprotein (snRNP)-like protein